MNLGEMREMVLSMISRNCQSQMTNGNKLVDIAINNALTYTQRKIDFEWNKHPVYVRCNPKGSLFHCRTYDNEEIRVKRIIKAFGSKVPTGYGDTSVPYLSRTSQIADSTMASKNHCCGCTGGEIVIHEGNNVYISPAKAEPQYDIHLFAVIWLPRLKNDLDTNFILEYGSDFIMYKAIEMMNYHIKEDERFALTKRLMDETWQSIVQWDATHVSPTETEIEL